MTTLADIVLIGTRLRLDAPAAGIAAVLLALCIVLAVACRPTLKASPAARVAFAFLVLGAVLQCLAGELLLFLTGGAVLGYSMLALGLAGPRPLTRFHALAAAILIVAGDLAQLELVMLVAKSSADLSYSGAGAVFEKVLDDPLARFCLVLGFGSRIALVALCVPEGRSSAANIATLPGWILLGLSSTVGAVRLSCSGKFGASCAAPLLDVLWWVPVLAALAWQLPRTVPALLRLVGAIGSYSGGLRDALQVRVAAAAAILVRRAPQSLLALERCLTRWPVAMSGLLIALVVCAVVLFLGSSASPTDS